MSAIFLQDETVHYEVQGRGRPLIFLHGWVGSWRYWMPAMQAASISYRTYALDLWGFGDSGKVPEHYTLEQQVDLLSGFLQATGLPRVALVGHGLGAVVSVLFANKHPVLVDRVMSICLPGSHHRIHPRLYTSSLNELVDWLLKDNPQKEAIRNEAVRADSRAIQYSLSNLQRIEASSYTHSLRTPCLSVFGANDPVVGGEVSPDQLTALPNHNHSLIFEKSGHFPMLDEPNKFNRLLVDFLALGRGESMKQLQLKEEWKRTLR